MFPKHTHGSSILKNNCRYFYRFQRLVLANKSNVCKESRLLLFALVTGYQPLGQLLSDESSELITVCLSHCFLRIDLKFLTLILEFSSHGSKMSMSWIPSHFITLALWHGSVNQVMNMFHLLSDWRLRNSIMPKIAQMVSRLLLVWFIFFEYLFLDKI